MKLLAMISLRNLFRQKRRNVLLGIAIAVGVMILIIANSFSQGITDVLMNKIIARVAGHITIAFSEKSNMASPIFRDKERILSIVKENSKDFDVREIQENIGIFGRAIGNRKSDNVVVVGIDFSSKLSEETKNEIKESFIIIEPGVSFDDLLKTDVENPTIISEEKAKFLNLKKGDIIRVRYKNLFGNDQAARLTVIGTLRNDNVFMQGVIFTELGNLKKIMGFSQNEVGNISVTLKNASKDAVKLADLIHSKLKPDLAVIQGKLKFNEKFVDVTTLGFKSEEADRNKLFKNIKIIDGEFEKLPSKKIVMINQTLASNLNIKKGDEVELIYKNKFNAKETQVKYTVSTIFENNEMKDKNILFMSENKFYDTYYDNLPDNFRNYKEAYIPSNNNKLFDILTTEWTLLHRTATTEEFQKKYKDIGKKKWKSTTIDVQTMYESASDVLKLEKALHIITITAVLILFFIILIGVINTLRMTIRERTREIGTMRAIGMQKNDVRNSFILETFFLTFFASIVGVILAFVTMHMLESITFVVLDNPMSVLLVNRHLYFLPTFFGIISNVALILFIAIATAYFPARRAANLSPANALRHYE